MDSEKRPVTTGVLVSFASLVVIIAGLKAASPIVIPLLVAGFTAVILSTANRATDMGRAEHYCH